MLEGTLTAPAAEATFSGKMAKPSGTGTHTRRLSRWLGGALAAAVLAMGAGPAQADLRKGLEGLTHGDYALAERALRSTKGSDAQAATLALARLQREMGKYPDAIKTAKSLLKSSDTETKLRAHLELATLYKLTGLHAKAVSLLEPLYKAHPKHLPTRHGLGLALVNVGRVKEANVLWNLFFDDFGAGAIDDSNAEQMFLVAEAAKHLHSVEDANSSYQEATEIQTDYHQANLAWGSLFLSKYAVPDAEQSFSAILKTNPKHADALAALAAAQVREGYNADAAKKYAEKALESNPNHVGAMVVLAALQVDRGEWDKAKAMIKKALKVNPESFDARAILATIAWLHDDFAEYEAQKKRVFAINPMYSRFFHIMMHSADREHRYEGGVKLGEEAVKVNPSDYEAMQLVGSGYLRLSREKEGVEWLRKAYYGDQYNARTVNLLDLFEKFIPREYVTTKSKTFNIRYHKEERKVLERYLTPTMEEAHADMVKRYGFTPKKPLTLEIYKAAEHFSTRTTGVPGLGALGVCFGHVVTAMSPSVGNLNWKMVMWHELSHVFAIQLSDYRVPRWFTEGLSEYETIRARPEWRRENDADLWVALQNGTLPSVSELNLAFMKPSMQAVVVAYHLSSVTIEYIVAEYGFDAVVKGLRLFAKGQETPEVIEKITGRSVATFDKEFRAHLRRRLAAYKGSYVLPSEGFGDIKALQEAAKKAPKDAKAQAQLALGYYYAGKAPEAAAASADTLKLDAQNAIAHYVSGELAVFAKDAVKAKEHFETLVKAGHDNYDIRLRLAMIAMRTKDKASYVGHMQSAKVLDPEKAHPYEAMAEFYQAEGKTDEAMAELENYVMIEQMEMGALLKLMDHHAKAKRWSRVVHFAKLAVNLDPANSKVQLALGDALVELGRSDEALYAYDTALLIRPRIRRPALAHLGRAKALLAKGDKKNAKSALQDVIDLEPDNGEGLRLMKGL